MRKTASGNKDIARIDQESKRTFGWYVRVRFEGKTHSKFFADKMNGGKNSSLLAAITWRDRTRKKIGKPQTDRMVVTIANNSTGVVGVRLNEKLQRYEVSWVNREGRQGKTSVSIKMHGIKKAFIRACKIRKQKEEIRLAAA